MKKTYMKPTTKVVYIHHTQMLCASPNELSTYSGDDDAISEKEDIW